MWCHIKHANVSSPYTWSDFVVMDYFLVWVIFLCTKKYKWNSIYNFPHLVLCSLFDYWKYVSWFA